MSPLTTHSRGLSTEVRLGLEDGIPRPSVANLDVIITESKKLLQERIAALRPEKLEAVTTALQLALGSES